MSECFLECIYLFCHAQPIVCVRTTEGFSPVNATPGNVETALGGDEEEEGGTRVLTIEDKEG